MNPLSTEEVFKILHEQAISSEAPFAGKTIGCLDASSYIFSDPVNFDGAHFVDKTDFKNADFHAGASFVGTVFEQDVDFSFAQFRGTANFWKSQFIGPAHFFRITVTCEAQQIKKGFPGEANFSYARFENEVSFQRARFQGPAYFYRTIFGGDTISFEEARFDEAAIFEGQRNDICFLESELPRECIQYLKDKHYAVKCADIAGYLNFDIRIRSLKRLQDNLNDDRQPEGKRIYVKNGKREPTYDLAPRSLNSEQRELVYNKWRECSRPMFKPGSDVSFQSMMLIKPGSISFSRIDLSPCTFRNTRLKEIVFIDVQWAKAKRFGGIGSFAHRCSLRDESQIDPGQEDHGSIKPHCLDVRELYHDLRVNYEAKGLSTEARDFYYGQMEMEFRSRPPLRRLFSITSIYRLLSAFGTQEPLALIWLVAFVSLVFPLLYIAFGTHDYWVALLRSLETATFFRQTTPIPGSKPATIPERLLEGIERIIVAVQASLFILAAKARFKP